MGEPRAESGASDFESDYQVISLSISWGLVSVVAFIAVLALQLLGRRLGLGVPRVFGGTLLLSLIGLLCGLIGLRFGRARGAARAGAFLNGVVLLCIAIILPFVFQILRRLI
jgi:hypothetical protein